jgi:hypothetical protein
VAKVYFGRFDGGDRALFVIITYELLLEIVPHRAVLLGRMELLEPATTSFEFARFRTAEDQRGRRHRGLS